MDVKKAAAKDGVKCVESKFINALAEEISILKEEKEKERLHYRDKNKGLQAQLRDMAEAEQEVKNVVEQQAKRGNGEADLFLSDDSIPPGIENVADDPERDVCFLEELLMNNSILSHESYDFNFEDNPLILRPPSEPPDVESFFDLKPGVIDEEISDKLNEDKCFKPRREINVSTKIEDDDYFPFMFVIRFFHLYFILPEIFPLFLSAESEDTIFDHGISK
nr:kinesin-like protein KIN12B [Tanacetum cinerariifolium]